MGVRRHWVKHTCAVAVGLMIALVALPAAGVAAHAAFVTSNPIDGSVLAAAPAVAELRFDEEVLLGASRVTLLQLGPGTTIELGLAATDNGLTLRAALPVLGRGEYVLRYIAVDPADLHKTVGSISFGIGVPAPPSRGTEQLDGSWLSTAIRAVTDGALMLGAGAAVVIWLAVRRRIVDVQRLIRVVIACAWVTSAGWVLLLVADAVTVGWTRVRWGSLVLASDPGRRALIGVQLAAGTWWAARSLRTTASGRELWARALATIALGFVVVAAYGGHAGIGGTFAVGVTLRAVHLASSSIWIGAVVATWMLTRTNRDALELWRPVGRAAAIGVALTGASGFLLSGRVAATVTALLGTTYGRVIVAKIALLVALALLGAVAARRVAGGRSPRNLTVEATLGACAVALAAVLASSAPALGAQFLPKPVTEPQLVTAQVADLIVSASIEPARPGPNLVQLRVLETRRPSPGSIDRVTMRVLGGDGTVVTQRDGVPDAGLLEWPDVAIASPGDYRIQVDVSRGGAPVPSFDGAWRIDVAPVARAQPVLSDRSWGPLALILGAAWIAVAGIGRAVVHKRAARARRPVPAAPRPTT